MLTNLKVKGKINSITKTTEQKHEPQDVLTAMKKGITSKTVKKQRKIKAVQKTEIFPTAMRHKMIL